MLGDGPRAVERERDQENARERQPGRLYVSFDSCLSSVLSSGEAGE
jgi:hypothetical protein